MIVDFHSHTYKSDGTSSPAELHALMIARGVEIYAVTDHDTLAAYPELPSSQTGPRCIVGIEINTTFHNDDVHILGYRIPSKHSPIDAVLERHRKVRADRMNAMVQKLRGNGISISLDDIAAACADASAFGRPHIAKVLVQKKYADSVEDAFARYLCRGCPGFIETEHLSPFEAIRCIKEAGGVAVLAHPGRLKDTSLIPAIVEGGIEGIEVFYGTHTPEQVATFRQAAEQYHLVMSAGADFHDVGWTPWGVGMQVDERDITPFLSLVGAA